MIADLNPYAEYKKSGLPWLGKVPGHLNTRGLKHLRARSALYVANVPASDYGDKQFVDNESFKQFLGDMVYAITNS